MDLLHTCQGPIKERYIGIAAGVGGEGNAEFQGWVAAPLSHPGAASDLLAGTSTHWSIQGTQTCLKVTQTRQQGREGGQRIWSSLLQIIIPYLAGSVNMRFSLCYSQPDLQRMSELVHCTVPNKRTNNWSDQLPARVSDSTKNKNTIPRNICGRICDIFIVVILYLPIHHFKWFLNIILIKLPFIF